MLHNTRFEEITRWDVHHISILRMLDVKPETIATTFLAGRLIRALADQLLEVEVFLLASLQS